MDYKDFEIIILLMINAILWGYLIVLAIGGIYSWITGLLLDREWKKNRREKNEEL